jgi:hypothetical protein
LAVLAQYRAKLLAAAALAALWTASPASPAGQILDRVVASVEAFAVTESDVKTQYRLERFLDGHDPATPPQAEDFARVRDRLIDQRLLLEEAESEELRIEDFLPQAAEDFKEVRAHYESEERFQSALATVGLSEDEIIGRMAEMNRALRVIDVRLRPAAWVEMQEVETYYREVFVPEFERRGAEKAPPLDAVENEIREILIQRKVDELLSTWLSELKTVRRVRVQAETAALEPQAGEKP